MSSKAGKMEKQIVVQQAKQAEQKVKNIDIQIDVDIIFSLNEDAVAHKTVYVKVTGVPEDLPVEMENTVISHAEKMFTEMLNSRIYQEFYNRGKTSNDEDPEFFNLSHIDVIKVVGVKKIN